MSTILTCTDGSLYAPGIYQHASWAASRLGASIHVLHVIERDESPDRQDLSGSIGFDANAGLLEELAKHDESHARVARLRGKAILQDAVKQLAGHEVKTTQRHGRWWKRSMSLKKARNWSSSANAANTRISPRAISAAIWNA
jgi:hypothetical protein